MNNGWEHIDQSQTQEIRVREPASEPKPERKRGNGYILTGLVLGVILGLIYAWLINPVIYTYATPVEMNASDRDTFRSLIAQVYTATGDLERAQMRLALLEDDEPYTALGTQAQRCMAAGNITEAQALALLASALQNEPPTTTEGPIPTQTLDFSTQTP